MQVLLIPGGPLRRHADSPCASRHELRCGVARADAANPGISEAYGLALPLGVGIRDRFQSRLRRAIHKEELAGEVDYNYHKIRFGSEEAPGLSVFYKDEGGDIFHTYSTYARGLDALVGTYQFLDLVPKGRDEDGLASTMSWVRHHDRYGDDYVVDPTADEKPREKDACCETGSVRDDRALLAAGGHRAPSARRLFGAAASVVPGVLLALFPKCPLCLAAWLTHRDGHRDVGRRRGAGPRV